MHYLFSVYFDSQHKHVSGTFVAHHQEVYSMYTTTGTCCAVQLLYTYSIPPDDGLQMCTKRAYVD
jgi:hypothetical protein